MSPESVVHLNIRAGAAYTYWTGQFKLVAVALTLCSAVLRLRGGAAQGFGGA